MGGDSLSSAAWLGAAAPNAAATRRKVQPLARRSAGLVMGLSLGWELGRGVSGDDFEGTQLRRTLLVPRHGDIEPAPFGDEDRGACHRARGNAGNALIVIGVLLL